MAVETKRDFETQILRAQSTCMIKEMDTHYIPRNIRLIRYIFLLYCLENKGKLACYSSKKYIFLRLHDFHNYNFQFSCTSLKFYLGKYEK